MERSPDTDGSMLDTDEVLERSREVLGSPLYEKSLYIDRKKKTIIELVIKSIMNNLN